MKYKFIRDQQNLMSVKHMCTVLQVSRSAYYSWQQATISTRETQNQELVKRIAEIHQQSHRTYGSPRIWHALRQQGIRCSRKRIARLMHIHGIRAKMVNRFKVTTHSRSTQVMAPDLVQRQFIVHQPNRVWTSDITYIWTREGWAYLAVVLDLCSRMIVGWEVSSRLTASLVTTAVERALYWRRPDEELILHSDRGSQYASTELRSLAKEQMLRLSMGRTGSCYDNAVTESFFHTLKTEHIYFHRYDNRQDARTSIFEYIETFYNQQRLHSSLGNRSPVQFELQLTMT
jgi:transposase InsO family protein